MMKNKQLSSGVLRSNGNYWLKQIASFSNPQLFKSQDLMIKIILLLLAAHCASIRGVPVLPEILSVVLGKYNLIGGDISPQEREVSNPCIEMSLSLYHHHHQLATTHEEYHLLLVSYEETKRSSAFFSVGDAHLATHVAATFESGIMIFMREFATSCFPVHFRTDAKSVLHVDVICIRVRQSVLKSSHNPKYFCLLLI